jgi:hypothetical protein
VWSGSYRWSGDYELQYAKRTALTKAKRGAFRDTSSDSLLYELLKGGMAESGVDKTLVEDIIAGTWSVSFHFLSGECGRPPEGSLTLMEVCNKRPPSQELATHHPHATKSEQQPSPPASQRPPRQKRSTDCVLRVFKRFDTSAIASRGTTSRLEWPWVTRA